MPPNDSRIHTIMMVPSRTFNISSFDWDCVGGIMVENSAYASATWPAANEAILVPFRIPSPVIVTKMFCSNGAAVSGNLDIGIYAKDGTRIINMGETAQAGISVLQEFNITDTPLSGPDWFYMGIVLDNTTGTFIRNSSNGIDLQRFGVCAVASDACPLPANATLAAPTRSYLPEFGLTVQAVI